MTNTIANMFGTKKQNQNYNDCVKNPLVSSSDCLQEKDTSYEEFKREEKYRTNSNY